VKPLINRDDKFIPTMEDDQLLKAAEKYSTPLYVYDGEVIQARCRTFKKAFDDFPAKTKFMYAVKANTNLAILKLIRKEGFGADIVSLGELDAVQKSGYASEDIIYSSNGKGIEEVKAAVEAGVNLTVGNIAEIDMIKSAGGKDIAFRLNPEVDAKTHPKISTSLSNSKFGLHIKDGVALEAVKAAVEAGLKVNGIQCHIGSNVKSMDGFQDAAEKLLEFAQKLKVDEGIELDFIDLGGGLGISYQGEEVVSVEDFAIAYKPIIEAGIGKLGYVPEFWFEPGRYIVAEAGILLARINSVKKTPHKSFINVDAGFNDLLRPAMYEAYHNIRILGKDDGDEVYDIAGNLCESGDILGRERKLPKTIKGDVIAIENAGAYGYSMASNYNSMPLPAEVLIRGDRVDLIRERQDIEELYIRQVIPEDLL
jgi:diaminopimelate decarboxylase